MVLLKLSAELLKGNIQRSRIAVMAFKTSSSMGFGESVFCACMPLEDPSGRELYTALAYNLIYVGLMDVEVHCCIYSDIGQCVLFDSE